MITSLLRHLSAALGSNFRRESNNFYARKLLSANDNLFPSKIRHWMAMSAAGRRQPTTAIRRNLSQCRYSANHLTERYRRKSHSSFNDERFYGIHLIDLIDESITQLPDSIIRSCILSTRVLPTCNLEPCRSPASIVTRPVN